MAKITDQNYYESAEILRGKIEESNKKTAWYWLKYSEDQWSVVEAKVKKKGEGCNAFPGMQLSRDPEGNYYSGSDLMEITNWITTLDGEEGRLSCIFMAAAYAKNIIEAPFVNYTASTLAPFKRSKEETVEELEKIRNKWKPLLGKQDEYFRKLYENEYLSMNSISWIDKDK